MSTRPMTERRTLSASSSRTEGTDFPELRVIHRDDLLLHEKTDAGREVSLVDRISTDGVLRNPPIAARLTGNDGYLLLDGANRVAALDCLDVRHLLVQVEEYEDSALRLSHWNHVLRDVEAGSIIELVNSIPGLFVVEGTSSHRPGQGEARHVCAIVLDEERVFQAFGGHDVLDRVRYLGKICNLYYHGLGRIDRVNHTDLDTLRKHHRHFGALIVYPDFAKHEIQEVAEAGERLPSGLTRFLMPRRVLGFNVPLELLRSGASVKEKQRWVEDIIDRKVAERKVRYYEEPAFVFDD